MPQNLPQKIIKNTKINFTIEEFGLYAVSITASCQKKHDLKIKIDGQEFREIPVKKYIQTYNIPPTWNGTKLKGLKKTVIFLLKLNKGNHIFEFFPKSEAILKNLNHEIIIDPKKINFNLDQQAEDGDKRSWFTFALIDLPLKSIVTEASVSWHWFDGDDIKLVIDNSVEKNPNSRKWKYWIWHANFLQIFTGSKKEEKKFNRELSQGTHYIDFWADKTPTLHQVSINLGDFELKRIPTKDDPKWTKDFKEDTETTLLARLIFGEANGQPHEAKLWVGWSVINRLKANSWWGNSIKEVILKKDQYDPFKGKDDNFKKIIDPLNFKDVGPTDKKSWYECYQIAEDIVNNKIDNPTKATHFNGKGVDKDWFLENIIPEGRFIKQIGDICFYWSPK